MYRYKVLDNRMLTSTVRLITLKFSDGGTPLLYEPGQYAAISLHDNERPTTNRCFSIASSSLDHRIIQFSIRVGGKFTRALERLKPDDNVIVRGPFGAFVFNEFKHKDIVLLAGGIGVAPFISMIRYASKMDLENKIHLVFSVRTQDDIPFFEELQKLRKMNPNLRISYIVGQGETDKLRGYQVLTGRVDDDMLPKLSLKLATQTYMMCGPPPYMTAVQKLLERHNVAKRRILSEAFSLNHGDQTGKLKSWPFSMYALTGLAFITTGFFITAKDLYKTLPPEDVINKASPTSSTNVLIKKGSLTVTVNSVPPQVDTDISQKAIVQTPVPVASAPTYTAPIVKKSPVVVSPRPAPVTARSPAP